MKQRLILIAALAAGFVLAYAGVPDDVALVVLGVFFLCCGPYHFALALLLRIGAIERGRLSAYTTLGQCWIGLSAMGMGLIVLGHDTLTPQAGWPVSLATVALFIGGLALESRFRARVSKAARRPAA